MGIIIDKPDFYFNDPDEWFSAFKQSLEALSRQKRLEITVRCVDGKSRYILVKISDKETDVQEKMYNPKALHLMADYWNVNPYDFRATVESCCARLIGSKSSKAEEFRYYALYNNGLTRPITKEQFDSPDFDLESFGATHKSA